MSTMKNGQILPYCNFSKIIKGPGTSFQSPTLNQKHVRNGSHTAQQYLTKYYFDSTQDVAMPMMTSQILKSVDFTKTQKSRYLEDETFFLQIKKFINFTSRATYFIAKNSFVAEKTFDKDFIKDALSGLRQFSGTESPVKMMKKTFYFTLKALFILKIF